ncbi:MAG: dTDP-4-dehydrorhamnose 3,5-epimerase family protein [Solirubrobacterales bacterium]
MSCEPNPSQASAVPAALPAGVRLLDLTTHPDDRGDFTELFREVWDPGLTPVQWNLIHSGANVMRGMNVHIKHTDYLVAVDGAMTLALSDLRSAAPTQGLAATVELSADPMRAVLIPPGVAHGFFFSEPTVLVHAVDRYWDLADELGCRWDDPALGIRWPGEPAIVGDRDLELPSLDRLLESIAPHQSEFWPSPVSA